MTTDLKKSITIASERQRTDNASATRFININRDDLRFVVAWKCWLAWTGKKWCRESGDDRAMKLARQHAKDLWLEAGQILTDDTVRDQDKKEAAQFARQSNDARRIENMIKLAKHDERVSIRHSQLDNDPYLLNVLNGTIELKSGTFREHQQEDLITQLANVIYDPNAECPQWRAALELIFAGDQDLIRYVQATVGYCLSGDVSEHILPIAVGNGANGKSTIWNVILAIMGDYGMLANDSLLLGDKDNHPTEKAMLYGKRFVPISEPERGARMKESRVKELTGDSTITARRMKEDFWSFDRTHKFFLATNHLPKVDGTDEGIRRRLKIIPFSVDLRKATTPIPDMIERLKSESSGILNWLLAGWRNYQANGLQEPHSVTQATGFYRQDSDALGQFIVDWCVVENAAIATANELYKCYQDQHGGRWSKTAFGKAMAERFDKEKPQAGQYRRQVIYHGIRLQAPNNENSDFTEENSNLSLVVTSSPVTFPRVRIDEVTPQLVTTGDKVEFEHQDRMEF